VTAPGCLASTSAACACSRRRRPRGDRRTQARAPGHARTAASRPAPGHQPAIRRPRPNRGRPAHHPRRYRHVNHRVHCKLRAEHGGRREHLDDLVPEGADAAPEDIAQVRRYLVARRGVAEVDLGRSEGKAPRLRPVNAPAGRHTAGFRRSDGAAGPAPPRRSRSGRPRAVKRSGGPARPRGSHPGKCGARDGIRAGEHSPQLPRAPLVRVASAEDQQHRHADQRTAEVAEQLHRGWLGPLNVVQQNDERLIAAKRVSTVADRLEQQVPLGRVIADRPRR